MIARDKLIFVIGQDVDTWCKRFGLERFTAPCRYCRFERPMTRAFFCGQLRGLAAADACEGCGDTSARPPYCFVRDTRFGDLFDGTLA